MRSEIYDRHTGPQFLPWKLMSVKTLPHTVVNVKFTDIWLSLWKILLSASHSKRIIFSFLGHKTSGTLKEGESNGIIDLLYLKQKKEIVSLVSCNYFWSKGYSQPIEWQDPQFDLYELTSLYFLISLNKEFMHKKTNQIQNIYL